MPLFFPTAPVMKWQQGEPQAGIASGCRIHLTFGSGRSLCCCKNSNKSSFGLKFSTLSGTAGLQMSCRDLCNSLQVFQLPWRLG